MRQALKYLLFAIINLLDTIFLPVWGACFLYYNFTNNEESATRYLGVSAIYFLIFGIHFCVSQIISILSPRRFKLGDFLTDNKLMLVYDDELTDNNGNPTGCFQIEIADDDDIIPKAKVHAYLLCDRNTGFVTCVSHLAYDEDGTCYVDDEVTPKLPCRYYLVDDLFEDENTLIDTNLLYAIVRAALNVKSSEEMSVYDIARLINERSDGCLTHVVFTRRTRYKLEHIDHTLEDFERLEL